MTRILRILLPALALVLAGGLATARAGNAATNGKDHNQKFTFTDVAFPDGTSGTIRAGVKINNQSTDAEAGYYTPDDQYLGRYQEVDGFASTDPDSVRRWALDHYADRQ